MKKIYIFLSVIILLNCCKNLYSSNNNFWDSVGEYYSQSDMTHLKGDAELLYINEYLKNNTKIEHLISLGCADGKRDPISLISTNFLKTGKSILLNDISKNFIEIAKQNTSKLTTKTDIQTYAYHCPITDLKRCINKTSQQNYNHSCLILGIYDIEFIEDALCEYKKEKNLLGKLFTISTLHFDRNSLSISDNKITFDIANYKNKMPKILNLIKNKNGNNKQIAGLSISTNNGFISHYYNNQSFKNIIYKIFDKDAFEIEIKKLNSRYLIAKISKKNITPTTLITMINNVLGNIPHKEQLESLVSIKNLFLD